MADRELLRADVLICRKGLSPSRERAQALIAAKLVYSGGAPVEKPAQKLPEDAELEIRGEACPYVSRGGYKLEKALQSFDVPVKDIVAVDIGASTGGFTDVLLRNGACRVYAVDVGTGQLAPEIADDPRVAVMEQTNARTLTRGMFEPAPALGVMDVSFISILKILPALRDVLGEEGRLISLIKPQFEAGREALGKNGIVSKPKIHEKVLADIEAHAPETGWRVRAFDFSPISGGDGNIEFLADFVPDSRPCAPVGADAIRSLVKRAHEALKKKQP